MVVYHAEALKMDNFELTDIAGSLRIIADANSDIYKILSSIDDRLSELIHSLDYLADKIGRK